MEAWRRRAATFLFPHESDNWLAILRIGFGLQLAAYVLSLTSSWNYFLASGGKGLISREVSEAIVSSESPFVPRIAWLVHAGARVGVGEDAVLTGTWIILLLAACCLVAGFFCRTAAVTGWLLHLCVAKSGGLLSYGVDNFMTIGLFYLMWAPFPDRYSLDAIWSRESPDPRLLGFFRRLLQWHMCVIYFFGGLTKCLGSGWWDGSNLWRALTREPFNVIPPEQIVAFKTVLPLLGIAVWLIEIAYPVFIWRRRTRKLWLVLTCGMHLAIGLTMRMHLFALVMIALNLAAFGPSLQLRGQTRRGVTR